MGDLPLPLLDDDELQKIYCWVDSIPLSRPKRNIARDLSDGGACWCRARFVRDMLSVHVAAG